MNGFRTLTFAAMMLAASFTSLEAQRDPRRFNQERRRIDTTFAFSKNGKISLEMVLGDIRVTGWARNEVRIVATTEGPPIDARFTPEEVALDLGRGGRAHYELNVPIGVSVEASSQGGTIVISGTKGVVSVETRGATVEVSDVVGRGDFESAGGRMTLQRLDGQIAVATLGAPVSINEIKGTLELESTGGGATVERAELDGLDFTAVSGSFVFSGTLSQQGRHALEMTGGSITLRFPENFGASLQIETWSGQFHPVDFAVTLQPNTGGGSGRERSSPRQHFTINGGGARIRIETNSGDVYLRKIGAPAERRQQ